MKKLIALLLCVMVFTSVVAFADEIAVETAEETVAEETVAEETATEETATEETDTEETATEVTVAAPADEGVITITINGEALVTDVAPQLVNDRTMVPMRAIFEALGANVTWFEEDQLIFATKDDTMIVLQIGNPKMQLQRTSDNGVISIELDTAPYLFESRTLVPVRAVSEALRATVDWIGETNTVVITK